MRIPPRVLKSVTVRPTTGKKNPGEFDGKIRLAKQNFDLGYWVKPDPKNAKGFLYGVGLVGKSGKRLTSDIARVDFLLHNSYAKPHLRPQGPKYEFSTFSFTRDTLPVTAMVRLKSTPEKIEMFGLWIHPDKAPQLYASHTIPVKS